MLPGTLAPWQQSHLVQLASWMPFRHASRVLEELLGVYVSPETARRLCEEVGKLVEEKQTDEAHQPWKQEVGGREDTRRLAVSADGAMVPLTGGEWAEVRTLAIGEVPDGAADLEKVHVGDLSYFSRLTDAATFTDLAEVETRRRRLVQGSLPMTAIDRTIYRRMKRSYAPKEPIEACTPTAEERRFVSTMTRTAQNQLNLMRLRSSSFPV